MAYAGAAYSQYLVRRIQIRWSNFFNTLSQNTIYLSNTLQRLDFIDGDTDHPPLTRANELYPIPLQCAHSVV